LQNTLKTQKKRNMPFFSIIIPTYNRDHTIRRPIASILALTFTDWELIRWAICSWKKQKINKYAFLRSDISIKMLFEDAK
jgi:GT2 family glycosyltransferase